VCGLGRDPSEEGHRENNVAILGWLRLQFLGLFFAKARGTSKSAEFSESHSLLRRSALLAAAAAGSDSLLRVVRHNGKYFGSFWFMHFWRSDEKGQRITG
jgi:hypothetical protein